MSALNFYNQIHRAILLTDAAAYDDDGTVTRFKEKYVVLPAMGVVIASTGMANGPEFLSEVLRQNFEGIDDFAARGPRFIEEDWASFQRAADELGSGVISALVVGWSKVLKRPLCVSFDNREGIVRCVVDIEVYRSPALREESRASLHRQIGNPTVRAFDPVAHGLPLLEVQRRQAVMPGDLVGIRRDKADQAIGAYLVGGHVALVTVDRNGIQERILKTWDDQAGERIHPGPLPTPAAGIVVPMIAMNRKERRRQAAMRQGAVA